MEVFLQVRRKKTTIFLTVKENTNVAELKLMLSAITNTAKESINLFNAEEKPMVDDKTLADYGLMAATCKAQQPGELVMSFKDERVMVIPYSNPPELPEVMRQQENSQEQQAAA